MRILLKNVRGNFLNLFETEVYQGRDTKKYSGTFLLDKEEHKDTILEIQNKIAALIKEKIKSNSLGEDRICLKDGDKTGRAVLSNVWTIKASNYSQPAIVNQSREMVKIDSDEADLFDGKANNTFNVVLHLWAQVTHGGRINGELKAIQFNSSSNVDFATNESCVKDFEVMKETSVAHHFKKQEEEKDENPFM